MRSGRVEKEGDEQDGRQTNDKFHMGQVSKDTRNEPFVIIMSSSSRCKQQRAASWFEWREWWVGSEAASTLLR